MAVSLLLLLSALTAVLGGLLFSLSRGAAGAWHIETDYPPYTRQRAEQTGRLPL